MSKLSQEAVGRPFIIDSYNIHRLVIAGVTVASKFFSDVFYTNSRYAKVCCCSFRFFSSSFAPSHTLSSSSAAGAIVVVVGSYFNVLIAIVNLTLLMKGFLLSVRGKSTMSYLLGQY